MDQQNGLFGFLENHVMGPMGKLAQFKVVRAITVAGMAAVPFTIVGSMFLVFSILPQAFSFWPIVADIFSASFDKFTSLYMVANYATMGSLSLYFVLSLAYELTKIYAEEEELNMNPLNGALLALMAFVMTVPQIIFDGGMMKTVTSLKEGAVIADGWAMGNGVARFGTTGIFTAIIMAIVTVLIYRMCVKHNWVIKMPEAVPEGVSRGFTALVPGFVVAFVSPIALANMAENAAGGHFAVAGEFSNMFVIAGGSGATLGLCLYIAFASKSEQLKAIGRASVVPALFNINEPLIFGLPIIYNPALAIPFILAPMVTATIYYVANSLNFIKPIIAQVPWPTPVGIGAFLGTADLRAVLVALVCAFAAFLVYLPFIRVYDQKLVKEEQGI
ncbi:PTS transporter subunit EIIC [Streptococcus pneumoniae]|uniref:PTS transporter subunit EIIC n=1 Tax=Streptococcus pneumoniae TaxID=1313 RepID=UPI0005E3059A|nr:PTS transporter subunit EIIC [Streptococcus pneumoniae]CKI39194.1 PTS system transporter subunit IIC [Streptococcus pneumoniae]CKI58587.1 PTS system transporter subunit IIC [Streptococcus pneumoniae]CKI72986.1 PTS system transporter subunit IIC [Streptococcus pneumoniae]CKJ06883.1 PTS system transporter subunit IIC [Streptococcus pneumoniae]CKJ12565.1 PTS system transporter subunit IIC [Streptococcus pneumoniae]